LQKDAASLAEKLAGGSVTIRTKAGASGKIFGSVTALQIANALKDQGFDVDRKSVSISEDIKNLGSYQATINLFKGVNADIEVHVVQE
jgi:large subunit ribosomal protein L9